MPDNNNGLYGPGVGQKTKTKKPFYTNLVFLIIAGLICIIGIGSQINVGKKIDDSFNTPKSAELREKYDFYDSVVHEIVNQMKVTPEQADDIFLILVDCGLNQKITYIIGYDGINYTVDFGELGKGVTNLKVVLNDGVVSKVSEYGNDNNVLYSLALPESTVQKYKANEYFYGTTETTKEPAATEKPIKPTTTTVKPTEPTTAKTTQPTSTTVVPTTSKPTETPTTSPPTTAAPTTAKPTEPPTTGLTGYNTQSYDNGDKYSGNFENGVRSGQGTYTWSNGTIYKGEFVNGNPSGKGDYIYPTEATTAAPVTAKSGGKGNVANFYTYDIPEQQNTTNYVLNLSTKKFHYPWCPEVKKIKPSNYATISSREEAIKQGYVPCKKCDP